MAPGSTRWRISSRSPVGPCPARRLDKAFIGSYSENRSLGLRTVTDDVAKPSAPRPPWSPTAIALTTLVLSPIPGGILHALNCARLGHPERRRLALFVNLGTAIMLYCVATETLAGSLLLAAYFYKTQERAFQAYRSGGGQVASIWVPVGLTLGAFLLLASGLAGLYTTAGRLFP